MSDNEFQFQQKISQSQQKHQPIFVSIEGIDGAGKSLHVEALAKALRSNGRETLITREPGGTALAEKIRQLVLHEEMDALTEALLVFAARQEHIQKVIRPALESGTSIICDRFTDASYAYQGGGRGLSWQRLERLEQWVQGEEKKNSAGEYKHEHAQSDSFEKSKLLQPDCTIWFDVPPAVAAARLRDNRTPDRFEREAEYFFERVAAGYQRRAEQDAKRFVRIDGNQPRERVLSSLLSAMQARGYLPKSAISE